MSARAVIFDMDGLLIDSERVMLQCWRETAAAQSLGLDDAVWLSMVGLHDKGCAELLDGLLGAEQARRLTLECKRGYDLLVEDGLPLKAGARGLLQDLFDLGVPLAVATSSVAIPPTGVSNVLLTIRTSLSWSMLPCSSRP